MSFDIKRSPCWDILRTTIQFRGLDLPKGADRFYDLIADDAFSRIILISENNKILAIQLECVASNAIDYFNYIWAKIFSNRGTR